ncbi:MAG: type II toxin-antitoxin system RelE/ParE family toxin [Chitinispirillaceae bacterium]
MMREVVFYRDDKNKIPVQNFLDSLAPKQAQRVAWVLELIEELEKIPKQYFKKLINTDDIWEIRIQAGNNTFRILSFFDETKLIVAAHGFAKKSRKVPRKEIIIAEKRKSAYFRRKHSE